MDKAIPYLKQRLIDELEMLSSEKAQLNYEHSVPHVDITRELICGWFDDIYQPDDSQFTSCFTKTELALLAAFHQFYNESLSHLPDSKGTVCTWHMNSAWREIMNEASRTLQKLKA